VSSGVRAAAAGAAGAELLAVYGGLVAMAAMRAGSDVSCQLAGWPPSHPRVDISLAVSRRPVGAEWLALVRRRRSSAMGMERMVNMPAEDMIALRNRCAHRPARFPRSRLLLPAFSLSLSLSLSLCVCVCVFLPLRMSLSVDGAYVRV
jgi:hypothetical protein